MTPLIRHLKGILQEQTAESWNEYTVPGIWVDADERTTFPSAAAYLLHQLSIIDVMEKTERHNAWDIEKATAYNCYVRHVTAYEHGSGVSSEGWRETGTFLKLVGLLPYLKKLGIDTLVLMPITEVGLKGKKGTLGSPYSVRHPLHLEPTLAEPAVPMPVEDQARALVECCHALGIKVILETVLRTASIDSDLVQQHPEWFYWIDEGKANDMGDTFRAPAFSESQLKEMKEKVDAMTFVGLPEPSEEYQNLFSATPFRVEPDEKGWRGIGPKARTLRIPGAFADWPADDPQPAWTDVTYLRLHDHPHYHYMAYNTVRMYESALETDEYRVSPLWNTIASMIPYYVRTLNIDGAMIDMGHALPRSLRKRVIREARESKPGFLILEENFHLRESSADNGYDAAIGYLPFDAHDPDLLKKFILRVADKKIPIRYFASPESHNTPRAVTRMAGPDVVANVWLLLQLLPGSLGYVHAGIELGEDTPVNTGLEFTPEEIAEWPPERLPLFSNAPLNWDQGIANARAFQTMIQKLIETEVVGEFLDTDEIEVASVTQGHALGYWRFFGEGERGVLAIHESGGEESEISVTLPNGVVPEQASGCKIEDGQVVVGLLPRQTKTIRFTVRPTSV